MRSARILASLRPTVAIKALVIVVALALLLLPLPARFVERFYSNGLYSFLQPMLTPVTNLVPFAIVDLLLVIAIAGLPLWWTVRIRRAVRGQRRRAAGRVALDTLALAAVVFITFQILWGFNYERQPLRSKLDFEAGRVSPQALAELRRAVIEQLNTEAVVRRSDWPDEREWRGQLLRTFNEAVGELGNRRGIAAGRPKHTLMNFYLAAAGIEGFVNPFGLEVVLESSVLPFEKPFLLAHEWGHLAGFADESEASFVGLLACLHSDSAALRYAGWLALYLQLPDDPKGEAARLAPEVVADLRAIVEREARRRNATISRVQWKVYDQFLKASGVEAGVASYGMVVRLVLGTRFEQGWIPTLRQ
ncbi:MAG TPA: DUF3810 family protein [Blastocatellia bacterium]|nr:DUF3810 family protein [Blastocatellia bacterium]